MGRLSRRFVQWNSDHEETGNSGHPKNTQETSKTEEVPFCKAGRASGAETGDVQLSKVRKSS